MSNKKSIRNRRMELLAIEEYILSLLKALAKSENKEFVTNYRTISVSKNFQYSFDGYAPNGISEIEGPVIVEIKNRFLGINRVLEFADQIWIATNDKNMKILFVFTDKIEQKILKELPNTILCWDKTKINELIHKFPEVSFEYFDEDIINKKFESYSDRNEILNKTVRKFENIEYNENKNQFIKDLQNSFLNDNLTLFLGSGVSKNVKLPNWNDLMERLMVKFLKENYDENYDHINIDAKFKDFSYITLGSLVKHALQEEYHQKLRDALYEGHNHIINNNSCLKIITTLCMPPRNGIGIQSIVTYNYDDLLEFYLDNSKIKYKIIFNENEIPTNDELPIYHVHGYLPHDQEITELISDSIILAEDEYHSQYKDPYSWQNLIQLNLLKEKTALFIGLSMNDPNLRRLLDIAKRYSKGEHHYAIIRDRWRLNDENLSNIFRNMDEALFKKLGLNIIWYRDYSEINDIIKKIIV